MRIAVIVEQERVVRGKGFQNPMQLLRLSENASMTILVPFSTMAYWAIMT